MPVVDSVSHRHPCLVPAVLPGLVPADQQNCRTPRIERVQNFEWDGPYAFGSATATGSSITWTGLCGDNFSYGSGASIDATGGSLSSDGTTGFCMNNAVYTKWWGK